MSEVVKQTSEKCACHLKFPDGTRVAMKDSRARSDIAEMKAKLETIEEELQSSAEALAMAREELEDLIEQSGDNSNIIKRLENVEDLLELAEESQEIIDKISELDGKYVERVNNTSGVRIYANKNGEETGIGVTGKTPKAGTLPLRETNGHIYVPTNATEDGQAVSYKQFLEVINGTSQVLQAMAGQYSDMVNRVATLEASSGNLDQVVNRSDLDILSADITLLGDRVTLTETNILAYKNGLESLKTSVNTSISEQNTKISNALTSVSTMEGLWSQLGSALGDVQSQVETNKSNIETNGENILALASRVSDLEDIEGSGETSKSVKSLELQVAEDGTNIDDYKTAGLYYFSGSKSYVGTDQLPNLPDRDNEHTYDDSVNGWLEVFTHGNYVRQIFHRHGSVRNDNCHHTFVRNYCWDNTTDRNYTWSEWKRYISAEEVESIESRLEANETNIGTLLAESEWMGEKLEEIENNGISSTDLYLHSVNIRLISQNNQLKGYLMFSIWFYCFFININSI